MSVDFFDKRKGVCSGDLKEIKDYNIAIFWDKESEHVQITQKLPDGKAETHYVFSPNIIYLKTYA